MGRRRGRYRGEFARNASNTLRIRPQSLVPVDIVWPAACSAYDSSVQYRGVAFAGGGGRLVRCARRGRGWASVGQRVVDATINPSLSLQGRLDGGRVLLDAGPSRGGPAPPDGRRKVSDGGCRAFGAGAWRLTRQYAANERENRVRLRFLQYPGPRRVYLDGCAARRRRCRTVSHIAAEMAPKCQNCSTARSGASDLFSWMWAVRGLSRGGLNRRGCRRILRTAALSLLILAKKVPLQL